MYACICVCMLLVFVLCICACLIHILAQPSMIINRGRRQGGISPIWLRPCPFTLPEGAGGRRSQKGRPPPPSLFIDYAYSEAVQFSYLYKVSSKSSQDQLELLFCFVRSVVCIFSQRFVIVARTCLLFTSMLKCCSLVVKLAATNHRRDF